MSTITDAMDPSYMVRPPVYHTCVHDVLLSEICPKCTGAYHLAVEKAETAKQERASYSHVIGTKPSNPKDALGIKKVPLSTIPRTVLAELGVAMMEGAMKYGRHNYRVIGVRASVYNDAVDRHLSAWWEGEDTDPDSGLSHVTKAIASLTVLRDAMICGNWVDDRPPCPPKGWLAKLNDAVAALIKKYPDPVKPYTQIDQSWVNP